MKKILFAIIACLMTTITIHAQSITRNEIIDEMLEGSNEIVSSIEEMLASQGIKSKIRVFFDSTTKELVFSYQFFDEAIFNTANLENMKKGGVQGIVAEVLRQDSTGEGLEWIVNEFKRTKTYLRYEVVYVDNKSKKHIRSARVTPEEIQRLASLLY